MNDFFAWANSDLNNKKKILTVDGHTISFCWEPNRILIDDSVVGSFGFSLTKDLNDGGNRLGPMGMDEAPYIVIDGTKHHIQLTD